MRVSNVFVPAYSDFERGHPRRIFTLMSVAHPGRTLYCKRITASNRSLTAEERRIITNHYVPERRAVMVANYQASPIIYYAVALDPAYLTGIV